MSTVPTDRIYSSTHTGRAHRTVESAFRGADYGQAIWPPEQEPPTFWSAVAYWAALVLCVLTFVMLTGCVSEADADQAVAAWADEPLPQSTTLVSRNGFKPPRRRIRT
ncbi:hypothetical protein [Ottowia sp. VDI28]|uniref:hypothetical protein n=1 Tax=Ottowia sp. VDI28 TaxID=3133968 RepID=UPI003C2C52B5